MRAKVATGQYRTILFMCGNHSRLISALNFLFPDKLPAQISTRKQSGMNDETTEKPQILVVDDSKVIRRAAIKMLGDGYQVHEAVDGMDSWQQLQRNDAISVVFTDMQMPEMNGMELLANIRNSDDERLAALPVIMITGVGDTEDAKRMVFDAGAIFLAGPSLMRDLTARLWNSRRKPAMTSSRDCSVSRVLKSRALKRFHLRCDTNSTYRWFISR